MRRFDGNRHTHEPISTIWIFLNLTIPNTAMVLDLATASCPVYENGAIKSCTIQLLGSRAQEYRGRPSLLPRRCSRRASLRGGAQRLPIQLLRRVDKRRTKTRPVARKLGLWCGALSGGCSMALSSTDVAPASSTSGAR